VYLVFGVKSLKSEKCQEKEREIDSIVVVAGSSKVAHDSLT